MTTWLLRRILQALFVMAAMSVIVFVGIYAIGNPADMLVAPDADQAERARIVAQFGLDLPLWKQYFVFVGHALHGDLGTSFVYNEPAVHVILQRAPATLELAVVAMLIAVLIAIPAGLFAGMYPNHVVSRCMMGGSILGFSLPSFWVGLTLIMLFSVYLGWLPSNGRGQTASLLGVPLSVLTIDGVRHLILPALNLALFNLAVILRLTRAGVREILPMEFIRYARARGLTPGRIVGAYVLRNVLVPIVTVVGLEFGASVAFAVVTETIFSWPGIGKLLIDSINMLDRPVVVAYLLIIVMFFTLINLVTDLLYGVLDPRARVGAAA